MNATMGTNIRVVMGYNGTSGVTLALERGEIQAMTGWDYSSLSSRKADWLKDKKVRILVQFGRKKHPKMPNVPLASQYTTTKVNRDVLSLIAERQEIGRPYVAPPDVPADRLKLLRASYQTMLKDPGVLKEGAKLRIEVHSSTAEECLATMKRAYSANKDVVAAARKISSARCSRALQGLHTTKNRRPEGRRFFFVPKGALQPSVGSRMTLPGTAPASTSLWASTISLSGKTFSITTLILPSAAAFRESSTFSRVDPALPRMVILES